MGPQATKNITSELFEKLAPMLINLTNMLTYTVNYSGKVFYLYMTDFIQTYLDNTCSIT